MSPTTQPQGLDWVNIVIGSFAQANVAIPIIFGTITSMVQLYRSTRGEAPLTPDELRGIADQIDAQIAANDTFGKAEITRLKALIAARTA